MAFTVNFYSIAKRDNSTLVPTNPIETAQCVLKDGASLLDPVLLLEHSGEPYFSHFAMLGRYYKVTDIRSVRQNLWELAGTVDVLASWKSNILATSAFVAYDTTANTEITDRRLSTKTTTTRSVATSTDAYELLTHTASQFTVILNCVAEERSVTYATTVANAAGLLNDVATWTEDFFSDYIPITSWEELGDMCCAFFKNLIATPSAANCIKSAYLLPINYNLIPGTHGQTIYLGQFETGMQGTVLTTRSVHDGVGVRIPWQATDWRRNAPYHEIYLYIPFMGVISFPASALIGAEGLYVGMSVDLTNGETIYTVTSDSVGDHVIAQYNGNIAMNYAIGSSNITPMQTATAIVAGAVGTVATVATGGAAAAVAAGSATIAGELNAVMPMPSSIGSAGGGAILGLRGGAGDAFNLRCLTLFHDTNVAPDSVSAVIGTPTNAVKSLAGLTGYVETRNFSVSGAMTDRERADINRLMDGGVYIE